MKILYVAMKYDYGVPAQGTSLEHNNFYEPLVRMGHDVIYFDYMTILQELGRDAMNRRLLEVAGSQHPELLFCVLFGEELDKDVMRRISASETTTVNWFSDDHWRFERYSRFWAPCFNWVVTTANSAIPKYAQIGYRNVIKSQWACNHYQYKWRDLPVEYDVTFVGLPHGDRREVVAYLRRNGVDVRTWGKGWESGRAPQEEMIRIFNQSRINLNFMNPSSKPRLRRWLRFEPQIKTRTFEIPGCGGFQLSGMADDLDRYFRLGEEIALFGDRRSLLEKVRYYLGHEAERAEVAKAGLARVLSEHTYDHRFADIFKRVGVGSAPTSAMLSS